MEADRSHLHHTLMDLGLDARQTLALLICWASICVVTGLLLEAVPAYLSLFCYFLVFAAHCLFVVKASRRDGAPLPDTLSASTTSGESSVEPRL